MKIEACDLRAGQVVLFEGQHRTIEKVTIESGTLFSVQVKFEGIDEPYLCTEGDYLMTEPFVVLRESCSTANPNDGVKVFLTADGTSLWIRPEGYADCCSADGHGFPIGLEFYNGRLRLIVYNDINEQDPQIIDLEKAKESNRNDRD